MLPILLALAVNFGVVADDGADDRLGLQAAIDAAEDGAVLQLPPGVVETTRSVATSNPARLSDLRSYRSLTIRGADDGTSVLRMTNPCLGARYLFDALGITSTVTFVNLKIERDVASTTGCGEQTHLVQISGAHDIVFDHVTMSQASAGLTGTQGGDCIKLVAAEHVTVKDSFFDHCDRSGVSVHRDVHGLTIRRTTFVATGDQDIDLEPPSTTIQDVQIEDISIIRTRPGSSIAATRVTNFRAKNVTIIGGGNVFVMSASPAVFDNVNVECAPGACLTIRRNSRDILIKGGIWRGAGGGPVVYVYADRYGDGATQLLGIPGNVVFDGVTLVQPASLSAIEADSVNGIFIFRSTLIGPGEQVLKLAPIVVRSVLAPVSGAVQGNALIGWSTPITLVLPRTIGVPWFVAQ